MTRVFIDARSHRGSWAAAQAAGLCDLSIVALAARESPCKKMLSYMSKKLRETSAVSEMSIIEIPCHTVDAVDIVKELASANDIIVTDSAPFAHEFLLKEGMATDTFGEKYTWQNIDMKVRYFNACQELKHKGVNPHKPRAYRAADCKKLFETVKELAEEASGAVPRDMPLKFRSKPSVKKISKPLSPLEFEKGPDAKVFIDGDACPRLPAILEICGNAQVPVVYVSNQEVTDLIRMACRNDADFMSRATSMPDITIEKVPVKKDAADKFIAHRISPGDIVLTDDNGLAASCLNKDALAIDFKGYAVGRSPGSSYVRKNDVRRMKEASRLGGKKGSPAYMFRASLMQAVG